MTKSSHPYFIPNDPDRHTTAVLLTGTAEEFGIDQHDIQVTAGGFNVTEAVAKAVYGEDFESGEDSGEEGLVTQAVSPGEPVVTGTPRDGSATTAPRVEETPVEDADAEPVDYSEWEYNDLKAEVTRRNLDTPDNKGETYKAALAADDQALAADDDTL